MEFTSFASLLLLLALLLKKYPLLEKQLEAGVVAKCCTVVPHWMLKVN